MKEYIKIYKEYDNSYYNVLNITTSSLRFLRGYFEIDYKFYYEEYLLNNTVSSYNAYFVYHDKQNKILYIGLAEWENSDGEIHCPDDSKFPHYVNEKNSCKINVDNFKEFIKSWNNLKQELPAFAIIYRDDQDWVDCKGFNTQEEMEAFIIKN